MKSTRSSGSARKRSSSTSESAEVSLGSLRRSSRDHTPSSPMVANPAAAAAGPPSTKLMRSRRRGNGLPLSDPSSGVDKQGLSKESHRTSIVTTGRQDALTSASAEGRRGKYAKGKERPKASAQADGPELLAVDSMGRVARVSLVVSGELFNFNPMEGNDEKGATTPTFLGQDGNLFYCVVCRELGDVVCCDGCPAVFHPKCIPLGSASRSSLDNDEDPWFCPDCMAKKVVESREGEGRSEGSNRRTIKHRCRECQQTRPDLALQPCKVCAVYIHFPSCRAGSPAEETTTAFVLCSSCRAEAALDQEEMELRAQRTRRKIDETVAADAAAEPLGSPDVPRARRRSRSTDAAEGDLMSANDERRLDARDVQDPAMISSNRKRKHPDETGPDNTPRSGEKKSKKKTKRKRDSDAHLPIDEAMVDGVESDPDPLEDESAQNPKPQNGPPTQATPAFHFYLVEQRPRIERVLSRKHRYFNRLPKGGERNALIAKEAAMQWIRLSSVDQKRYISMSMRDYENRIIAWKEEKNIRDMMAGDKEPGAETLDDALDEDKPLDDSILTKAMHERLYLGTSVGSKAYAPEQDQSHNRVLLDLLRDLRFHPLPMLSGSRGKNEVKLMDSPRVSIRHFDVHGPIATSVGDECLGCSRGWPHFCPVLQRRLPSIEQRAKLQPAASSLISTRVGLGLRPRLERVEMEEDDNEESEGKSELFSWREVPEANELRNVRFVPSSSLTDPSARADDIVEFIEEVLAMKIPEPSRPSVTVAKPVESTPRKSSLVRGTLPTRYKRTSEGPSTEPVDSLGYESVNKCGRCRTIIMTESGCVQCRRAQLVINMSKRPPPPSLEQQQQPRRHDLKKEGLLKVQTTMLGRVIAKEPIGENQGEAEKIISGAILRERWAPCTVLPKAPAPSPSLGDRVRVMEAKLVDDAAVEVTDAGTMLKLEPFIQGSASEERGRNARRSAAPHGAFDSIDAERQSVARQQREQADMIHKRTLSIACQGILLALMRRDPLLLFSQPVTADGYAALIKRPIDFGKIKNSVLAGVYPTLGAFVADVRLLCDNALIFNPPGSIYWKTAKELLDMLMEMQKRASRWISAMKNAVSSFWRKLPKKSKRGASDENESTSDLMDPFKQLRQTWPEAVDMYENSGWMRNQLTSDFTRTKENETAFYGGLAVRRAAKAAEVCLAPYTDTGGVYSCVVKRSSDDDEELRQTVDSKVAKIIESVQLRDIATGREETIVRLLRRVQSRRLERRIGSDNGCARCDGIGLDHEMKAVMNADVRWGRNKKKGDGDPDARVAASRLGLTTGLASANTRERIAKLRQLSPEAGLDSINDVCVSLRGSRIHGWGLFAEQPFKKGDIVAEYVGECVCHPLVRCRRALTVLPIMTILRLRPHASFFCLGVRPMPESGTTKKGGFRV
jgi:Bromodomain/PHD-finger